MIKLIIIKQGKQYAELHFENATARKQKIFEFDLNDLNVHSVTFQTTDFDWGLTEEQENRSISNQQCLCKKREREKKN